MVIKLSGGQIQYQMSKQHKFDLKSQVRFQTKLAQHKVQLLLYYIQFEIGKFSG